MNTPRMKEAWDKSSRTADGFYSSQTPTSEYATSCYDEGCKLERELAFVTKERDEAREELNILESKYTDHYAEAERITSEIKTVTEQRDRLLELHNKNAIFFNELLELCGTLRKERNTLWKTLQNVIDEDGTPRSIVLANEILQSLATNETLSNQ